MSDPKLDDFSKALRKVAKSVEEPWIVQVALTVTFRVEVVTAPNGRIHIDSFAQGIILDRPRMMGFVLSPGKMKLALRMKKAIEAGVVWADCKVKNDIHKKTYLCATHTVWAKTMNADLKRLGF